MGGSYYEAMNTPLETIHRYLDMSQVDKAIQDMKEKEAEQNAKSQQR